MIDKRITENFKDKSFTVDLDGWKWGFTDLGEAKLALAMWDVSEREINTFSWQFTAVLRLLGRTESDWA